MPIELPLPCLRLLLRRCDLLSERAGRSDGKCRDRGMGREVPHEAEWAWTGAAARLRLQCPAPDVAWRIRDRAPTIAQAGDTAPSWHINRRTTYAQCDPWPMPAVARGGAFLPHCLDGEALSTGRVERIRCSRPELRARGVRRCTGKSGRARQLQDWLPRPLCQARIAVARAIRIAQAAAALSRSVRAGNADIKRCCAL